MTALGLSPISEPDWPSWWPRSSTGAWKAPDIGNGTNLIALGNTSDVLTGSWVEGGPGDPALDGTHDLGWFSRVALWEVTGIPSPTPTGDVPISFDVTLAWSSPVGPIWGECGIQLIGDQQFAPLGTTIPVNQGRAKSVWPPMTAEHDGTADEWDYDGGLGAWHRTTVDWTPPPGTLPPGSTDTYHADYRLNTDAAPGRPTWNGRLFLAIAVLVGWGADGSYPPPLMFDAWQTWGVQVRNLQLGTLPHRGWAVGRLAW